MLSTHVGECGHGNNVLYGHNEGVCDRNGGALTMSSSNGAGNTVDGEDNSGGLTESLAYLVVSKRADISLYSLGELALRGGGGFNIKGVAGAQWDAPHMEPLLFLVLAQPRKLGYRN